MFLLLWVSFYFASVNSLNINPKICINCKYFIPDDSSDVYGKCSVFPKIEKNNLNFLVTGNKDPSLSYYEYCSIVRKNEDMCGKEGKKYKRKYIRKVL
jgi:hypothetical protein